MCDVHPAVASSTMTRQTEVVTRQSSADLPPGFLALTDEEYRTNVFQEPIELYYEVCRTPICTGQWASVYKCLELSSGVEFAAKFCSKTRMGVDSSRDILHEMAAMFHARSCPRVVRLHQMFETEHQFVLVMELGSGGDLQGVLDNDQVPYEPDVVRFIRNLLEGLAFLHDRDIAHLDIKPQNLVLTGTFPDCDIKLCDLEISRVISAGQEIREMLGTPDYVSPEILRFDPVMLSADIWSVGVLAYVLLTGFTPFGGDTDAETFRNIARAELEFPDELFEDVSASAKDFIWNCLLKDPRSRPTAHQLLQHRWLELSNTPAPSVVISPSQSFTSCEDLVGGNNPSTLRRSISKSREALSVKVSRSNLKKNISKSRERLCDMKWTIPMTPDQFPACLRSNTSDTPDNRPPWKGAGVQKTSPGSAKAERVNTFKIRDEYQNQVAASMAGSSQSSDGGPQTGPPTFARHGSLRGRRKTSSSSGSSTDIRSSPRRNSNMESAVNRRNSCQEDNKTKVDGGRKKKEGPKRTQSVSDAILCARKNRDSRKELLLPVEENRSGSESVDVLDDGQEMVKIRPGTFVIDMGNKPTKPRKMKLHGEREDKKTSMRESDQKNSSVDLETKESQKMSPRKVALDENSNHFESRSTHGHEGTNIQRKRSFEAHKSNTSPKTRSDFAPETQEKAETVSNTQNKPRMLSPEGRKKTAGKPVSLPASPRLAARSSEDRQSSPRRQTSPKRQASPTRRSTASSGQSQSRLERRTQEPAFERTAPLRSSLRNTSRPTRAAQPVTSRTSSSEESRRSRPPFTDEAGRGLRKSSTEEDMRRLPTQDQTGRRSDDSSRRLRKSSTDEDVRQLTSLSSAREARRSAAIIRNTSSPLLRSRSPTSDLGSSELSSDDWEQSPVASGRDRDERPESNTVSRAISRFQALEQEARQGNTSPTAGRSPGLSRKFSSPVLRSPDPGRKCSSPSLKSPRVTRKASSPALRSPCVTRKASSPALGSTSHRERPYTGRAPGLRVA